MSGIKPKNTCFRKFRTSADLRQLPARFNYPFNHQPHELCLAAAKELQEDLEREFSQRFSRTELERVWAEEGKMFGVLLVRNENGEIGYLVAFSGVIGELDTYGSFVPSIYNRLEPDGFFKPEESNISAINDQIEELESDSEYAAEAAKHKESKQKSRAELTAFKFAAKQSKKKRKEMRRLIRAGEGSREMEIELQVLRNESQKVQYNLQQLENSWKEKLSSQTPAYRNQCKLIESLKDERKQRSAALQQRLFDSYELLNALGESRSVSDIFAETPLLRPPAGSGDCAAPKMLQFAYRNNYEPLSFAEFWWGKSPDSQIRKQGQFYPACRGKCGPILEFMLKGLNVESDPALKESAAANDLEFLFEDKDLAVIVKPSGLLSAPGKQISHCVQSILKSRYPQAAGPLIVHRLDMDTSGIMLIALNDESHKQLQAQFIARTISKRYTAVLDGQISKPAGEIDLPLAADYINRPSQQVCYQTGKPSKTLYKVLDQQAERTRVEFTPLTGRTHQLRVHAAHPQGLNAAIVGDNLYGNPDKRLLLHASYIRFQHPRSKETMEFENEAGF